VTHVVVVIAWLLLSCAIDEARGDKVDAGIHIVVKKRQDESAHHKPNPKKE
jgi:hypothetical protein